MHISVQGRCGGVGQRNGLAAWCVGVLLAASVGSSAATYTPGLDVAGYQIMVFSGNCPAGFTQDNTAQGRYVAGLAASGVVGDTLGSAVATTTTDSSYTPVGTNSACPTTSAIPLVGAACAPYTPTFAGTLNNTMRSTIAPAVSVKFCRKV